VGKTSHGAREALQGSVALSSDSLDLPRPFGPYQLLRRLAVGGMAEVYVARARGIGGFEKLVAIKVIHPRYSEDEHFVRMLVEEAKISVLLTHVNIAQTFDLGCIDETYFIVMEYIEGADAYRMLKRASARNQVLPFDVCSFVASEVCNGLDNAHRKRDSAGNPLHIVHRDISPQNVLLSYAGEVKLVDFGIAKAALRTAQTEAGVIKGKYYYMSPEQAWGDPIDARGDVFSTGVVLYELITGEMLYQEDNIPQLLDRVRKAEVQSPAERRPDTPAQLCDIVFKAVARRPEDRFQSAREMGQALTDYLYQSSPSFSPQRLAEIMGALFKDELERHGTMGRVPSGERALPPPSEPPQQVEPPTGSLEVMSREDFAPDRTKSVLMDMGADEDETRHDVQPFRKPEPEPVSAPVVASRRLPGDPDTSPARPSGAPHPTASARYPSARVPVSASSAAVDGETDRSVRAAHDDWEEATAAKATGDEWDEPTVIDDGQFSGPAREMFPESENTAEALRRVASQQAPPLPIAPPRPVFLPQGGGAAGRSGKGQSTLPIPAASVDPSRPSAAGPTSRQRPVPFAAARPVLPDRPPPERSAPPPPPRPPPVPTPEAPPQPAAARPQAPGPRPAQAVIAHASGPWGAVVAPPPPPRPPVHWPMASPSPAVSSVQPSVGQAFAEPPPGAFAPSQPSPAGFGAPPPFASPFEVPPPTYPEDGPGPTLPLMDPLVQAQRRRVRGFVLAVAAMVVVGGLAAAVLTWLLAPAPPEPVLEVRSVPGGAAVTLDGAPVPGRTPLAITKGLRLAEAHRLEVSLSGYETWVTTVQPVAGRLQQIAVLTPQRATLRVVTEPVEAHVWVDDVLFGSAPVEVPGLALGHEAQIRVTKTGYVPARQTVRITADELRPTVTVVLTPLEP